MAVPVFIDRSGKNTVSLDRVTLRTRRNRFGISGGVQDSFSNCVQVSDPGAPFDQRGISVTDSPSVFRQVQCLEMIGPRKHGTILARFANRDSSARMDARVIANPA
jgi:hypothetical protein